jgi:hypothetical protein
VTKNQFCSAQTYEWSRDDPDFKPLLAELDLGAGRIRADLRRKPALSQFLKPDSAPRR